MVACSAHNLCSAHSMLHSPRGRRWRSPCARARTTLVRRVVPAVPVLQGIGIVSGSVVACCAAIAGPTASHASSSAPLPSLPSPPLPSPWDPSLPPSTPFALRSARCVPTALSYDYDSTAGFAASRSSAEELFVLCVWVVVWGAIWSFGCQAYLRCTGISALTHRLCTHTQQTERSRCMRRTSSRVSCPARCQHALHSPRSKHTTRTRTQAR